MTDTAHPQTVVTVAQFSVDVASLLAPVIDKMDRDTAALADGYLRKSFMHRILNPLAGTRQGPVLSYEADGIQFGVDGKGFKQNHAEFSAIETELAAQLKQAVARHFGARHRDVPKVDFETRMFNDSMTDLTGGACGRMTMRLSIATPP